MVTKKEVGELVLELVLRVLELVLLVLALVAQDLGRASPDPILAFWICEHHLACHHLSYLALAFALLGLAVVLACNRHPSSL